VLVPEYKPSDTVLDLLNSLVACENLDSQNRRHHDLSR